MAGEDVQRRWPRAGMAAELARAIEAHTGSPERAASTGEALDLLAALRGAFPGLPEADGIEGCTDHPALLVRFLAPGFSRLAVKVVFVPRPEALEARLRLELSGGSYKRETLARAIEYLRNIEAALLPPEERDRR